MMKKFIYKGSVSCHVSLLIKSEIKDFSLHKNEEYELPERDLFVKSLVFQKLLQPVTEVEPVTQTEFKKSKLKK